MDKEERIKLCQEMIIDAENIIHILGRLRKEQDVVSVTQASNFAFMESGALYLRNNTENISQMYQLAP